MTETFTEPLVAAQLEDEIRRRGLTIGLPITVLAETHSTNDVAARLAFEGAPHGALVVADRQLAGRGRKGRAWHSPAGQNLYLSLILRPTTPMAQLPSITLAVGLGVADALAHWVDPTAVQLKWPNDVLIDGKKAVGILTEASSSGSRLEHVIVGIGINVLQTSFEPDIASIATSIALNSAKVPSRAQVLGDVLAGLAYRIGQFARDGLQSMLGELRERDATTGRTVQCAEGEGVAEGIEADGRLRVRLAGGRVALVQAGDVKLVL